MLETGFGLGNNFLATWAAWRDDPQRCRQLHFISIEQHAADARRPAPALARDRALRAARRRAGRRAGRRSRCNLHRLALRRRPRRSCCSRFGDVARLAARSWSPRVDAFFLDGFAPARNPAMWDARAVQGDGAPGRARRDGRDLERGARGARRPAQRRLRGRATRPAPAASATSRRPASRRASRRGHRRGGRSRPWPADAAPARARERGERRRS